MSETFAPAGVDPVALSLGGSGWELNEYNGFNQLIKTTKDGIVTDYTNKPDGLRLSKTTSGVKTTHIWDGQNIVAEQIGSNLSALYLRGINLIYAQKSDVRS